MAIPSFFKTPEHRSFNFMPRYYNERKEQLEERVNDIKKELGIENEEKVFQSRITRGSMRGYIDKSRGAQKRSNIRLFIIIGSLGLLVYIMLFR